MDFPIKESNNSINNPYSEKNIMSTITPEIAAKIVKFYVLPMFNKPGNK